MNLLPNLKDAFVQAENDSAVKVIVLQANGGSILCRGGSRLPAAVCKKFSFEEKLSGFQSFERNCS